VHFAQRNFPAVPFCMPTPIAHRIITQSYQYRLCVVGSPVSPLSTTTGTASLEQRFRQWPQIVQFNSAIYLFLIPRVTGSIRLQRLPPAIRVYLQCPGEIAAQVAHCYMAQQVYLHDPIVCFDSIPRNSSLKLIGIPIFYLQRSRIPCYQYYGIIGVVRAIWPNFVWRLSTFYLPNQAILQEIFDHASGLINLVILYVASPPPPRLDELWRYRIRFETEHYVSYRARSSCDTLTYSAASREL
jgi:hypothetical protein